MSDIKTVAVEDGNSYRIINESDFDEGTMKRFTGTLPRDVVTDLTNRNTDGTFSEPTPTDIRFPNKDTTEFANNHGAFVGKSAAQMRADEGLADAPGGLQPDPVLAATIEKGKEAEKAAAEEAAKADAKEAKEAAKPAAAADKK